MAKYSERKSEETSLKNVLKEVMAHNRLDGGLEKVRVEKAWSTVLGPSIQKYTQSVNFNRGTLVVYLTSATMRQELSYGTQKIIDLINEEMGTKVVEKLVLR